MGFLRDVASKAKLCEQWQTTILLLRLQKKTDYPTSVVSSVNAGFDQQRSPQ